MLNSNKKKDNKILRRKHTVKIALTGILAALALAASFAEKTAMIFIPLPMGIKPGLSNIVVMFVCFTLGLPSAMAVAVIKSGFVFLMSGASSGFISLSGGILSVLAMGLLSKTKNKFISCAGISVISAVCHNIGQLTAASLIAGSSLYLSLAPILLLSGVFFGLITGLILNCIMPILKKYKIFNKQTEEKL